MPLGTSPQSTFLPRRLISALEQRLRPCQIKTSLERSSEKSSKRTPLFCVVTWSELGSDVERKREREGHWQTWQVPSDASRSTLSQKASSNHPSFHSKSITKTQLQCHKTSFKVVCEHASNKVLLAMWKNNLQFGATALITRNYW